MSNNLSSLVKITKSILKIIIVTFALVTIMTLLKYSNYGLDLTDEGSYLISMKYPKLFYPNSSQFGLIYSPIFLFFNNDIQTLRAFNILVTYLLATLLTYLALHKIKIFQNDKFNLFIISMGVGVTSFLVFKNWMITPNYNILNFHGLCIFLIGLILSKSETYPKKINIIYFYYFLIGLGGFLVFMAKSSTALLLLFIYIFIIYKDKINFSKKILFPLFFVCIFFFIIFKIHNFTLIEYIERYFTNVQLTKDLGARYTFFEIFRLDYPPINFKDRIYIGLLSLFFLFFLGLERSKKTFFYLLFFTLILFFSLLFYQSYNIKILTDFPNVNFLTLIISILLAYLLYIILNKSLLHKKNSLIWLLFILPFLFSFGSNGNYWDVGCYVSLFWCLGLLYLYSNKLNYKKNISYFLLIVILMFEIFTFLIIKAAINNPYRQEPNIYSYDTLVKYNNNNNLLFKSSFAKYIELATKKSELFNFNSSPMIDLSGQSPGLLFFLEAQPVGNAWLIGGYPGSYHIAKKALSNTPCSIISKSWLLLEPEGPRSISSKLLSTVGIDFNNDYEKMFNLETPKYLGGNMYSRLQIIYKPKNKDVVYNRCVAKRLNK